jgi:hypothetical protein
VALLPVTQPSTPLPGGYCALLQGGAEPGSDLARAFDEDWSEALRFMAFLEATMPALALRMRSRSALPDLAQWRDITLGLFIRCGKRRLADARTAVVRLQAWLGSPIGTPASDAPFLSAAQLAAYLVHVTQEARTRQASKGAASKDTAASKQLVDLKAFGMLTLQPLSASFEDRLVLKVVPPPPRSRSAPTTSSSMSVASQLQFEHLAREGGTVFIRVAASVASLMGIMALRGSEARRSSLVEAPSSPSDHELSPVLVRCAAGKGRSKVDMQPFDSLAFPEGFLGDARPWLSELYSVVRGRPFLLPSFSAPKGSIGNILEATAWDFSTVLPEAQWPKVFATLLALPPLALTPPQLAASGWDLHAPHSLGAGIIRSFLDKDFSAADFYEIGRWEHNLPDISHDLAGVTSAAMPLRYTSGATARDRALDLRRRICRKVSSFVAGRPWFTTVPLQRGEVPSYSFLRLEAPVLPAPGTSTASVPSPPDEAEPTEPPQPTRPVPSAPVASVAPSTKRSCPRAAAPARGRWDPRTAFKPGAPKAKPPKS